MNPNTVQKPMVSPLKAPAAVQHSAAFPHQSVHWKNPPAHRSAVSPARPVRPDWSSQIAEYCSAAKRVRPSSSARPSAAPSATPDSVESQNSSTFPARRPCQPADRLADVPAALPEPDTTMIPPAPRLQYAQLRQTARPATQTAEQSASSAIYPYILLSSRSFASTSAPPDSSSVSVATVLRPFLFARYSASSIR